MHTNASKKSAGRRHSSRTFSYSRPTTANPEPLVEHSEERSRIETPNETFIEPADANGAELDTAKTITEASEKENRRMERADTVKPDRPFTEDELTKALTSLTVKREPSALAAGS